MNQRELYDNFNDTVEEINNSESTDVEKLDLLRIQVINEYNDIVEYVNSKYRKANQKNKEIYDSNLVFCRNELVKALKKLNCQFNLADSLYELIALEDVEKPVIGTEDRDSSTDSTRSQEENNIASEETPIQNLSFFDEVETDSNTDNNSEPGRNKNNKMTDLTLPEFLKMASTFINKTFTGDPLALSSFIDSVRLLETLATTNALKKSLFDFVKTKIDGKAREEITDDIVSLEGIIDKLKRKIKPESSDVVKTRMMSLRLKMDSQQDFAVKAEELSEAFRRALVVEGIPPAVANEMTIKETVKICRSNARNETVKSVVAASKFDSPKEVIATLLTQIDTARQEHQVLSFQRSANVRRFNKSSNYRGRGRSNYQNNQNRQYNGYNNQNRQYQNRNGYNGQSRGYRGRGGHKGQYRGSQNNRGYYNQPSVRFFENQGNEESPPHNRWAWGARPNIKKRKRTHAQSTIQ